MDFDSYQEKAAETAVYNENIYADIERKVGLAETHLPYLYPVLGLAEEAGEVAGKVAKFIRKKDTDIEALRTAVAAELGDVLWMLSETARQFGIPLGEIAEQNLAKLASRKDRGVIVGEGDSR